MSFSFEHLCYWRVHLNHNINSSLDRVHSLLSKVFTAFGFSIISKAQKCGEPHWCHAGLLLAGPACDRPSFLLLKSCPGLHSLPFVLFHGRPVGEHEGCEGLWHWCGDCCQLGSACHSSPVMVPAIVSSPSNGPAAAGRTLFFF